MSKDDFEFTLRLDLSQLERKIDLGLLNMAMTIEKYVKELMQKTQKTGRQYYIPGTRQKYTASAPYQPPAVRTGRLLHSIYHSSVEKDMQGKYVMLGAGAKSGNYLYAKGLEFGTEKMKPRPAWQRVLKEKKDEIIQAFKKFF